MFHNWQIFTLAIMTSLSLSQCALAAFVITTATASALDLNGFIVGLILIPSGLANVIGSLVGGKLADVGRQKVGYGGRLLAAIVGTFFVLVFNICFGFTCQLDWWYPTIFTSLMALFRTIGVTGVITFCIEQDIHKSSSITAAINSTNYIMVCFYSCQFFRRILED
jgi:MFS family permease